MRNWNSFTPCSSSLDAAVFSVPMRNWNRSTGHHPRRRGGFSAYLWGIETTLHSCLVQLAERSFQRTYEELKQLDHLDKKWQVEGFSAYLWGIETPFFVPISKHLLRFQRTYEELKHQGGVCSTERKVSPFSAYLWGIETRLREGTHNEKLRQFSAYLWGIETIGSWVIFFQN